MQGVSVAVQQLANQLRLRQARKLTPPGMVLARVSACSAAPGRSANSRLALCLATAVAAQSVDQMKRFTGVPARENILFVRLRDFAAQQVCHWTLSFALVMSGCCG